MQSNIRNKEASSQFGMVAKDGQLILKRLTPEQHVRQCVRAIILTHVGERSFQPELGTRLQDYIFRPLTTAARREISNEISRAVAAGEPRIAVDSIEVEQNQSSGTGLSISVAYRTQTGMTDRLKLSV